MRAVIDDGWRGARDISGRLGPVEVTGANPSSDLGLAGHDVRDKDADAKADATGNGTVE